MAGFTGSGAAITFGTNAFTGKYREIGELVQDREAVDTTTLDIATGSNMQFIPGDNPNPGTTRCRIRWQGTQAPQVFAAAETITITMAKESSASTIAPSIAGTGFLISRRFLPNLQRNQLNEGEFTIQWSGVTGPTYTVES